MSLLLKVLSFKNQPMSAIYAVTIDAYGGSIGRSDDNALVLPDTEKFVSRHHASIHMENSCYYLSDTSLGGVYINGNDTPLHNATERIFDGTVLKIGEYEIAVTIMGEVDNADFLFVPEPVMTEPMGSFAADEPWLGLQNASPNSLMADNFPSHDELLQPRANEYPASFESALQGNHSPLFDSYVAPEIVLPPSPPPVVPVVDEIPDNLSFDDFFSELSEPKPELRSAQPLSTRPVGQDGFDDFFAAALGDMAEETGQTPLLDSGAATGNGEGAYDSVSLLVDMEPPDNPQHSYLVDESPTIAFEGALAAGHSLDTHPSSGLFADNDIASIPSQDFSVTESNPKADTRVSLVADDGQWLEASNTLFATEPPVFSESDLPLPHTKNNVQLEQGEAKNEVADDGGIFGWTGTAEPRLPVSEPTADAKQDNFVAVAEIATSGLQSVGPGHVSKSEMPDRQLFEAFLRGAAMTSTTVAPEQQADALRRVGRMFRTMIDGTVAVLRSRAEFKSLCRADMTIIRSSANNPLKFTISTDDVLKRLLDNKTEGFLEATVAIEEAFGDIMDHQLAMQAGIQASLADLLAIFDPKAIEKHYEQGIVLQKKAKCWDRYEQTYRMAVEEAVENFFGDEFVRAYDQQMGLLKRARKRQDG